MPGSEENTYGYWGLNGKKQSDGNGWQEYGPEFGESDVVGCGVVDGACFFTKNGDTHILYLWTPNCGELMKETSECGAAAAA